MRHLAVMSLCLLPAVPGAAAEGQGAGAGLRLVDNPALGRFVDITPIGTPIDLGRDGEAMLGIGTFPGNFVLLPGPVVAGQNGGLGFGNQTITPLEPVNQPIPSNDAFIGGQATLVYWDDIDDKDGDVFVHEFRGDPVLGDRLVVQWNQLDFDGLGSTLRAQVQVTDNVEPVGIYAQFLYDIEGPAAGAGASATIGYQNGSAAFDDRQFSFNQPDAVGDGTVLSLLIPSPADLDGDGVVGTADLLALLRQWGECAECPCAADLDGDCRVGTSDLLELLDQWQ